MFTACGIMYRRCCLQFYERAQKGNDAKFPRKCRRTKLHLAASAAGCHRDVRCVCRSTASSSRMVIQIAKTIQNTSNFFYCLMAL